MPAVSLSAAVQDTTPCGVLSQCWCSLTLTLTTSMSTWDGAGATKSWSSVVSLSCSCGISLCIWASYDPDGWATRIIHFRLLIFSSVSITVIRQETISLAFWNQSLQHAIEGRLAFRDISPVAIRAKRVNLLHRLCTKFSLISGIESARCSGKIAELSPSP